MDGEGGMTWALDLCTGKGGWKKGLKRAGYEVIGVDVTNWSGEGVDLLMDVRELAKALALGEVPEILKGKKISLVVASPPCQEFSYRSFPFRRARELAAKVPPDKSIWEACVAIAKHFNAPLILENVRGAEKYMGKAQAHCGSFYLWGDVPCLLPIEKFKKGFQRMNADFQSKRFRGGGKDGRQFRGNTPIKAEFGEARTKASFHGEYKRIREFNRGPSGKFSSHSKARAEWSARAAMIPEELSYWIGKVFLNSKP